MQRTRTISGTYRARLNRGFATALLAACLCTASCVLDVASAAANGYSCSSGKCSITFGSTGSLQEWQVPAGVSSVTFEVKGAGGGGPSSGAKGGNGASVSTTLAVSEKERLKLVVGAGGGRVSGGYGGGGQGGVASPKGGGGGGGSFVFSGGGSLLIAAAGGGGAAQEASGGNGGETGSAGQAHGLAGGGGATTSSGGTGGYHAQAGEGPTTTTAIEGKGGEGGSAVISNNAGGGGGGGLYGGGGGAVSSGVPGEYSAGGGGSSTVNGGSGTTFQTGEGGQGGGGGEAGHGGEITIAFSQPTMGVALVASSTSPALGQTVIYTVTVSPVPSSGSVSFLDGASAIAGCEAQTVSTTTGTASCEVAYAVAGMHSISASFSGSSDAVFRASSTAHETIVTVSSAQPANGAPPATPLAPAVIKTTPSSPPLVLTRDPQPLINAHYLSVVFRCGQLGCSGSAAIGVRLPDGRSWRLTGRHAVVAGGAEASIRVAVPASLRGAVRSYLLGHPHYKLKLDLAVTLTAAGASPKTSQTPLSIWTLPGFR